MRFLSFLDIICCTLLCCILIFKLHAAEYDQPQEKARLFHGYLEFLNPHAAGKKSENLEVRLTLAGDQAAELEKKGPAAGEHLLLGNDLTLTMPRTAGEEGNSKRFSLSLRGKIPGGSKINIWLSQPSLPLENEDLRNKLHEFGTQRVYKQYEEGSGLGPIFRQNRAALATLQAAHSHGRASQYPQWLTENLQALRSAYNATTSIGRRVETPPQAEALRFESHARYLELLLLNRVQDFQNRGTPQGVYLQEIALNFFAAAWMCEKPRPVTELAQLWKQAPVPEELLQKSGFGSAEIYAAQVHYYLQEMAGDSFVSETEEFSQVWSTGWTPAGSAGVLAYRLGDEFVEDLVRSGDHLFSQGFRGDCAEAHGRLFYELSLKKVDGRSVHPVLTFGSHAISLDRPPRIHTQGGNTIFEWEWTIPKSEE